MEKVLGIIAEYNPFHNGHLYHLNESKRITGCNYTVAIIGGNFTQRGNTSLVDKWQKTKMALASGIDLVIELPVLYSISSAENFASGAIKILESLGIISNLSFGAETDNIDILKRIANILCDEPFQYKDFLEKELNSGVSFPTARENALLKYLSEIVKIEDTYDYSVALSSPNNILAIEYLKALKRQNSTISPNVINRFGVGYNDLKISNKIASATAIREIINKKGDTSLELLDVLPTSTYSILSDCLENEMFVSDLSVFEKEIIYVLRKMPISEIAKLPDVGEGLEFSIKKAVNSCNNLIDLINSIKSKRYTSTRICRILLYALLGISKSDMDLSKNVVPYVRVLGFNKNGRALISEISKRKPDLNIITSVKKFVDTCDDSDLISMIEKDIFATNVYSIGFGNNSEGNLDFKNGVIKV